MLDEKTIEVIKSTVSVLQSKGEAITTRFYELLFQNHPELLNIFNHTNQKQGRQQAALAGAVYAAAAHIDNLEAILPAVKQIAHKHRSLGVQPEQYPIVGENLLKAIQEVLGLEADNEIIQAWEKAYGEIANVFISVEKEMYQASERQYGGWSGFRHFVVDRKVKESDVITSFYLKPEDGQPIASYQPGQYVSVKMTIPGETYTHIRQYSLSDAPGKGYYRISVKREDTDPTKPDGKISVFLHEQVKEGDILPVSVPSGDFVLNTETARPIVFISGGVGLTPLMSMLNTVVEQYPDRDVTFIQAAANGDVHAMREHVTHMADQYQNIKSFVCYGSPTEKDRAEQRFDKEGYVDLNWLKTVLPDNNADFYFCGPVGFMNAVNQALREWGVNEEQIHFEFFGPAMALESKDPAYL
jgi:nitric oxide dioxygenase